MTTEAVGPGTTWRRRAGRDTVLVIKVSANGNVSARRQDGKVWSIPLSAFINQWDPVGGSAHACARCGSASLRTVDKYCKECQALIARVRNAKRHEEDEVLTTTSQKLIEQRQQDNHVESASPASPASPRVHHWRILGHVVLELTVEGASAIDAMGDAESQYPGMDVTDVHRLD